MSAPPSKHKEKEMEDEDEVSSHIKSKADDVTSAAAATTDDAVDDTEDLPDDFVHIQKTISGERRRRQSKQMHGIQDLLPFPFSPLIRPLTISDLESCIALENAAFANPAHRCSRDKFEYRLTACPELCMGVFCTVVPTNTKGWEIDTLHTAHPVETSRDDGAVSVLLAHVVATRSHDDVVTDDAMDYPRDYKTAKNKSTANVGHQETGRSICIHSLAVHPKLQGVGMGKLIVKAYMQQVKNSELAGRIALICQEYLVNYYKRFGFSHVGPSKTTFSEGGWHDMVFDMGGSTT
ncbi:acyl-CoA N-acyltransferase [Xylariaceae sp. AK1471]|nr:acyl-CoA N-acyltransferase [Xylariaceae sp. AK1471]